MGRLPALMVTMEEMKKDPALREGGRGARKVVVTERRPATETEADEIWWAPPAVSGPCPVLSMANTEVAYFTHAAPQDRHLHRQATEMYMVLEGEMVLEVEGALYRLS